jgi:hypothetical protein
MNLKKNFSIIIFPFLFTCLLNNNIKDSNGSSGGSNDQVNLPPSNIVFKNVYYVSTTGFDSNTGSIDSPFATVTRALTSVQPGDCIYLRDGAYYYSAPVTTTRSGLNGSYIYLWAYQNEKPVIDFSGEARGTNDNGIRIKHSYWYLKGLTIQNASYNGIRIEPASYTLIVNCTVHDNGDTGLTIGGTSSSYNSVINSDSYGNYDHENHGQDADGFGAKYAIGPGNYFYGCRTWNNSDDGWDLWMAESRVIIENCWAFSNGINLWGDTAFEGNGNGIKLGGNYISAPHLVKKCLAFNNANKGFDQNNNTGPLTLYNNTSWHNNKNFGFWSEPASGSHVFKNNISFESQSSLGFTPNSIQEKNSWQGFSVTSADFLSLDANLALSPRQANGDLPNNNFLKLASSSSLINQGVDVGLPFKGSKPDLGAFESDY